jgi:hypothetical protein
VSTTDYEAGWYPDPTRRHEQRYYDGNGWTEHIVDKGRQGTDDPASKSRAGRAARFAATGLAGKAIASKRQPQLAAPAARADADGVILVTTSHDHGRNATVTLFADRIERVQERSLASLSRAKQDTEVTPIKAISSVQAKKDGLVYTKVTCFASGNNVEFRVPHAQAGPFKDAVMKLVLAPDTPSQAPTVAPTPDLADQLRKLASLRDDGILSADEFEAQKAKLLG